MSELKPCPFCGSKSEELEFIESVHCLNRGCHSIGPNGAIEAWNHRPFESHAVEVLAEQLSELDHYKGDSSVYFPWEDRSGTKQSKYRAQARELLGIEEGE